MTSSISGPVLIAYFSSAVASAISIPLASFVHVRPSRLPTLKNGLKKLMDLAQTAPETVILAEDEASLYLQATTTAVWAPRGQTPLVRVHSNRNKVSFYGSFNLKLGKRSLLKNQP
jgi:hypothetical protein